MRSMNASEARTQSMMNCASETSSSIVAREGALVAGLVQTVEEFVLNAECRQGELADGAFGTQGLAVCAPFAGSG